ncbi:MAG: cysteine synthase family protein [Candidatus Heimdallarchaeota archaeon]|nr:MAG: cysteine synthase family protein [Candidatus Heimdallarchaeota archaeon]
MVGLYLKVCKNILKAIGNTSLVQLNSVVSPNHAKILVKLEWENPTGSMKDRMAQAMIAEAERDGRLKKGGTVVEYTGGSTGTSLALICAVKGYHLRIVSSDAFSKDKINHMKALGADMTIVSSKGGGITKELIEQMIETARKFSEEPGTYWTDQLTNQDHVTGYHSLGKEIWEQTERKIDSFVQVVGSAASIKGISTILREYNPKVKIIAVEPAESAVLSGGKSGSHGIGGIGIGYIPPIWDSNIADDIITIPTHEAKKMARRLAKEEGLFAGTSSGANVAAAIKVAEQLGPKATVVTLMVDSGLKYLSGDLYK